MRNDAIIMLVLILLLVLLRCHITMSICIQKCYYCGQSVGEVSVEDCRGFINKTINITCKLNENAPFNSTTLYFERHETRLEDNLIIMVDNRTAVIPHIISAEDRKRNFFCYSTYRVLPVGKIEILYIDYYPQKVSGFHCIWEQLGPDALSCYWKHPVKYDKRNLQVTLEWKTDEAEPYKNTCPSVINHTECTNIKNIYRMSGYVSFRINVTNTKMNVTTSTVKVIRFPDTLRDLYGKPKSPDHLSTSAITQNTVTLTWSSSGKNTKYFISYNSSDGEKSIQTPENLTTVMNLRTYTLYKFVLAARYTYLLDRDRAVGIPSNPVSVTVRTSQDVAKYPPIVTDGGFNVNTAGSSSNVTVYWQNFNEMNLSGPIIEYEVALEYKDRTNRIKLTEPGLSQYTFVVNKNESLLDSVRIKSGTEIGLSEASPPIKIPKEVRYVPEVLLEQYNDGSQTFDMMLSWTADKNIEGYTVYWCENNNGIQNQINWKTVAANITRYNLENLDNSKSYFYGVSMEGLNTSTGFSWKGCYYKRDETPKSPKAVQMAKQETTKVTVTWKRPVCGELSPFVEYYIVYWCHLIDYEQGCIEGKNGSDTIYSSISDIYMEYTISELKSGSRYVVWLKAVSSVGKSSHMGEINSNITTSLNVDIAGDTTVWKITIGSVIPTAFLIILLLKVESRYHCCRTFFEKPEISTIKLDPPKKCNKLIQRETIEDMCSDLSSDVIGYVIVGHDNNALDLSQEQTGHQYGEKGRFLCNDNQNDVKERRNFVNEITVTKTSKETTTLVSHLSDDYSQIGKDCLRRKNTKCCINNDAEIKNDDLISVLMVDSSCQESLSQQNRINSRFCNSDYIKMDCLNNINDENGPTSDDKESLTNINNENGPTSDDKESLTNNNNEDRPTSEAMDSLNNINNENGPIPAAKSLSSYSLTLAKDDYVLDTDLLKKDASLPSPKETYSSEFGTLSTPNSEIDLNGSCQFGPLSSYVCSQACEIESPYIPSSCYEELAKSITSSVEYTSTATSIAEIQPKSPAKGETYDNSSKQSQQHIQLPNMNLIEYTNISDKIPRRLNKDDNATLRSNDIMQESCLVTIIEKNPKTNVHTSFEFENEIPTIHQGDYSILEKNFDFINSSQEITHCKNSLNNNGYKSLSNIQSCFQNNNLSNNVGDVKPMEKTENSLLDNSLICIDENDNCLMNV